MFLKVKNVPQVRASEQWTTSSKLYTILIHTSAIFCANTVTKNTSYLGLMLFP